MKCQSHTKAGKAYPCSMACQEPFLRRNATIQGAHDEDSLGQAVQVDTSLGQGISAMSHSEDVP